MSGASKVALVVKNLPANAGDVRDSGSIPGSGRFPGGGKGTPLQYSGLENPMYRGACWAIAHRVTKSRTEPKWLSMHASICEYFSIKEEKTFLMWNALVYESLPLHIPWSATGIIFPVPLVWKVKIHHTYWEKNSKLPEKIILAIMLLLPLLSRFSPVRLCVTP